MYVCIFYCIARICTECTLLVYEFFPSILRFYMYLLNFIFIMLLSVSVSVQHNIINNLDNSIFKKRFFDISWCSPVSELVLLVKSSFVKSFTKSNSNLNLTMNIHRHQLQSFSLEVGTLISAIVIQSII